MDKPAEADRGLSAEAREILNEISGDRAEVPDEMKNLAKHSPGFLRTFHETYQHVMRESELSPKVKELILVAVDAATYYHYGCEIHIRGALREGATQGEIAEALEVAGLAGGFHVPLAAASSFEKVLMEQERDD